MCSNTESSIISFLRLPLTLLVVFLHCPEVATGNVVLRGIDDACRFICECAMPLFMMISGYLVFIKPRQWNKIEYLKFLKTRLLSIGIPYLFWISFVIVLSFGLQCLRTDIAEGTWTVSKWNLEQWLEAYGITSEQPIKYPLWYLRDLMLFIVFTPVLNVILKRQQLLTLLLCIGGLFYPRVWGGHSNFWCALAYFTFGGWIGAYLPNFGWYFDKKNRIVYFLPILFCVVATYCLRLTSLCRVLCYISIIFGACCSTKASFLQTRRCACFSMFLYCCHYEMLYYLPQILMKLSVPETIAYNPIVAFLSIVLFAYVIFRICYSLPIKYLGILLWGNRKPVNANQ